MNRERCENFIVTDLLIKLINNDHYAFHRLYELYSPQLYSNLLKIVKDVDTAQDLLQLTFVKVWEKRHLINVEKAFFAYLIQISRNLAYDHFRKIALDKRLETYVLSVTDETYSHIEEEFIYKESNQLFLEAVAKLSPMRKQVFTLCKMEGKSYHEVSDLLNISPSTISDHLLKSNKFIRSQMSISEALVSIFLIFIF
ncbi:MAG: sigma-70 family RNA polymerase sigma factor [Candidatus Pedobacter colombiensis]|uniref:RNA polymerase sigma factor n=1 Tax=Candidatus Pedobacter colombiensis TaxID=3121371 RepID=A0AAJ5W622_9SPHI|nr:sigma-70 family RNA polymerase sigma factor [Pedobacter sp.]WEK17639.1 MAG: sigma-70 family RNA polymerase sigma factor [Pedobacter sp.]